MSEILNIDDGIEAETHPVRRVADDVAMSVSEHWQPVDIAGPLAERGAGVREGAGVTPVLSGPVNKVIQNGGLPFSLEDMLDNAHTGDTDGSSNVTAIHVLNENTVADTIQTLALTGQLDQASEIFETLRDDSDPSAEWLVAYTVFVYAKGWVAEQVITSHERFSKLFITNDQAGQDARLDNETEVQLKPVTALASNGPKKFRSKTVPHWFYQWTADGLKVAPTDEANEMNKRVAKSADLSATLIKRTHSSYKHPADDEAYRFLWW